MFEPEYINNTRCFATDQFKPKEWECKICRLQYTSLEKRYGTKCWQGHVLTEIANNQLQPT
jgi:hypothetical protein